MNLLAFDIGGANIKAAWTCLDDRLRPTEVKARSLPFELWREPHALAAKLREAAEGCDFKAIAVTMTGELCDCFADRRRGVHHILDAVESLAPPAGFVPEVPRFLQFPRRVWLTTGCFASPGEARRQWLACASANWHAQASWVARLFPLGASLLIDTGSTTTDIVFLRDGLVETDGLTDATRLGAGLIYTGATRTPVMSLSPVALPSRSLDGAPVHLIAEHFATMADVYLLTGDLPAEPALCDTADGRPRTIEAATARLLRMIGADAQTCLAMLEGHEESLALAGLSAADMPVRAARELAEACAAAQRARIVDGIRRVRAAAGAGGDDPLAKVERVIVTGSGDFVAAAAAREAFDGTGVPVVRLADKIGGEASGAVCAVALLHLWGANPPTGVGGL